MGMTPGQKKAWNKGFEEGVNSVEEGLPGWFGLDSYIRKDSC